MVEKEPFVAPGMEQLSNAPPPRRRRRRAGAVPHPYAALYGGVAGQEVSHSRVEDEPPPPAAGADSRGDQAGQDVAERPTPRPEVRMKQHGRESPPAEAGLPPRLLPENRETLNVKRNDRRRKAREHAPAATGAAQRPAAAERRANRPR